MELSKARQNIYSRLSSAKMREKFGLFLVEGYKSVEDTLGLFRAEAIVVRKGSTLGFKIPGDVPVYEATDSVMTKISTLSTPADVIAIYEIPLEDESRLEVNPDELYLLLDGVRDPGNMGTIIRTAHWFGIKKIFASRDCVDIYNPKTVQSTMGSLGRVNVQYCALAELIAQNGELPVYGTLLNGENIYKATLSSHGFIIMGNEGKGISEEIRRLVTSPLLIPPYDAANHSESLNVAVATAVTLSQFRAR